MIEDILFGFFISVVPFFLFIEISIITATIANIIIPVIAFGVNYFPTRMAFSVSPRFLYCFLAYSFVLSKVSKGLSYGGSLVCPFGGRLLALPITCL